MEKTLGQIVRENRLALELHRKDFAYELGISRNQLYLIENDKLKNISFRILKILSEHLPDFDFEEYKSSHGYYASCNSDTPGNLIKTARIKANLSQSEVIRECELGQNELYLLENDKIEQPHLSTLEKLNTVLDINLKELKTLYGY